MELGATQIMLQGGHNPDFGIEWYEGAFSAIKGAYPQLTLHSLGALRGGAHRASVSEPRPRDGHPAAPRGGASTRSPAPARRSSPSRPRHEIAPLKETGATWLSVMETAHGLGVESTATFMMGTGETNTERIEHLTMIRDVQDRTGGFRSFIPWTYQPENNHLKGRTQATSLEYLRLVAVARLFFDNVRHLQGSWLTTGKEVGQVTLNIGADDLGSVMLEEKRRVLGRRPPPDQPGRADPPDPDGRPDAPRSATTPLQPPPGPHRPGGRPDVDDGVVSHFSSTALSLTPA